MNVSIYKDSFDVTSRYVVSVDDALLRIKNGKSQLKIIEIRNEADQERQQKLKLSLPSVTFSGTFSSRNDDGLIQHSGFICLDFDHTNVLEKKDFFTKWEYTYATWISPRGEGVKVLVKIADGRKHKEHFIALKNLFKDTDEKCINVSRVCFESYDPDIFINTKSRVFKEAIVHEVESKVYTSTEFETYKKLIKWLENKGKIFESGNRNQYVFVLAGAMCRYGFTQEETTSMLQSDYTESTFPEKEIVRAVRSAFKKNEKQAGTCEFRNEDLSVKETKVEVDPKTFEEGFKPTDVFYGADVFENAREIYRVGYKSAESTHVPKLDEYFKWKRGQTTILSGIGNYGKTFYLLQLMLIKSYFDNTKWALFSPEHTPAEEFYFDLTESLLGARCDGGARYKPSEEVFSKAYDFVSNHFYYVYPESIEPSPLIIKTKFLELILKEKVDGVVIDPFNQLSNNYGSAGGRSDKYLETFLSDWDRFSKVNNVYSVIVCHPHKLQKNASGNYPCPDVFDLADGAMWNNKAYNILIYHRPFAQTEPDNPICEHHSKKIKHQKSIGKRGWFEFVLNRDKRRFYFDNFSPLDGNRFEVGFGTQQELYNPNITTPNYEVLRDFSEPIKVTEEDAPF